MTNTPICTIDETGIHRPTFVDCLNYFTLQFQTVFGNDIYIEPDSQDGQFLGLLASALDDINGSSVACYNAFSPSTAKGTGLSSVVKINGIERKVASFSTVVVTIGGTVGTIINNGVVKDTNGGFLWDLPPQVIIPASGTIDVTATCETLGAILVLIGDVTVIYTPVPGWQSVINNNDSSQGAPVEQDGQLRQRQMVSASLPSTGGAFEGLEAAIAAIPNLVRYKVYENADPADDQYGIPGNSIAVVVSGGDQQTIVDTIADKKGNGVRTAGANSGLTTPDIAGISRTINYSLEVQATITFFLQIQPLSGFTTAIQQSIQQSLSDWVNSLPVGSNIDLSDAYMVARLNGAANSKTYRIWPNTLIMGKNSATPIIQNISTLYYEKPFCDPTYVTIVISTVPPISSGNYLTDDQGGYLIAV